MSKKITTTPANCICGTYRITLDGVVIRKTATRPYQFASRSPVQVQGQRWHEMPKCSIKPFMGGVPVVATCTKCGEVWTPARGAMLEQVFKIRTAEWARIRTEMTAAGATVDGIHAACLRAVNAITPASCGLATAPAAVAAPANEEEWEVRAGVVQNPATPAHRLSQLGFLCSVCGTNEMQFDVFACVAPAPATTCATCGTSALPFIAGNCLSCAKPAPAGKVRVMADDFSDEPARNFADRAEILERIGRFVFNVNLRLVEYHSGDGMSYRDRVTLPTRHGKKFARIVCPCVSGGSGVFCFIDLRNGDILKAASWKAPAKHARGSVLADDYGLSAVGPYGPKYLTNSKSAGVRLIPGMDWE
jgi:hypothetical protein